MTDQNPSDPASSLHSSDIDQTSQSTSTTSHSAPIATVPPPLHNGNGSNASVPPSFAPLEPLDLERALKPIGIQNEQNTCFLNTVFQALMATQPLISVLNSAPELGLIRSPLNALRPPLVSTALIPSLLPDALEPPLYPLLPVTRAFLVALQKGWRMKDAKGGTIGYEEFSSDRSMRLNYLLREMAKKYDQYDDYTQQDAHELMRHLLDSMEMEEKDVIKIVQPPPPPAPKRPRRGRTDGISPLPSPLPSRSSSPVRATVKVDVPQTASAPALQAVPAEIPEDQRLIPFVDVLFGGSLASVIVCENCRAVSHTYEPFLDISLSLKRASADKTRKRDRFKAALGLKSRGIGGTYAKPGIDVPSAIASESELSDSEHHKSIDEEKNRRKSLDPDDRPKINDTTPDATPARQSSFKLGLKSKPSFSWRRKSRPGSSSSNISTTPMPEEEKAPTPPPVRSAPSSPRLSTVSERGHMPGLTRAQTAYLKRLLADPLSQQDNDPLAKLRAANSGEDVAAAGPSRTGLEQSLAAFTAVEILEGENGYACKKCWKIKAGKYKSTHPTVMEEDETRSPATSPGLVAQRVTSTPVPISASTSQGSIENLANPGINRAASTASRSSAGRPFRAPSPLRTHTEASANSAFDLTSIKSNEYSSIASTVSVDTGIIEPPIDPDSDGLSNTSSSSEDDYSHLDTTIPATRPSMPARKKSSHFIMRRAFKRYLIAKAPEVLVFHFKRFKQTQKAIMAFTNFYDLKKMDDYVSFPETLDLAPFMAPDRKDYKVVHTPEGPKAPFMDWQSPEQGPHLDPVMYRLYAVVVHLGSINEGHYIAYVLVDPQRMFGRSAAELDGVGVAANGLNNVSLNDLPDAERKAAPGLKIRPDRRVWCFTSDTSIRLADVEEVLAAKAYLCFYEKVN